jgi:outer membrane receptor protein involved in Fe transport
VDLGVTYYDAKSTDVILSLPVPPSTGYFSQVQNAAEITNKGLEIALNWRAVTTPAVAWTLGAQYARNKNKVTDLRGAEEFYLGGKFNGGIKVG